ncbi:unnamed protein product [Pleuronectes platessa]|uniref:Uncharacterized protein n=1 Tax=Pleuronectes platessa TaxID=8262 RepID=A0A9N7ZCZ2_PLEPL|nr:unnamed protein product [Pleuronectes platessa]
MNDIGEKGKNKTSVSTLTPVNSAAGRGSLNPVEGSRLSRRPGIVFLNNLHTSSGIYGPEELGSALIGVLRKKLLKLQITKSQRFFHRLVMASRWQQDEGETQPCSPAPSLKHHLHFMSLNCVCRPPPLLPSFPPPHRLGDLVPVTARPCTLEGAVID